MIGQASIVGRPGLGKEARKAGGRENRELQIGMGDEHDAERDAQEQRRHKGPKRLSIMGVSWQCRFDALED